MPARIEFTEAGVYSIKLVVTGIQGTTGTATTVDGLPAYVVTLPCTLP